MKRREIAKVLGRHPGSKAEVARRCTPPVKGNAVSMWLSGGANANVARHAEAYARELLVKEEADRLTRGEANGESVRKFTQKIRKAPLR